MFSMCSELTPRAPVPDNRIPQLMQPCFQTDQNSSIIPVRNYHNVIEKNNFSYLHEALLASWKNFSSSLPLFCPFTVLPAAQFFTSNMILLSLTLSKISPEPPWLLTRATLVLGKAFSRACRTHSSPRTREADKIQKLPKREQDHPRMNAAPDLNNHLGSKDLFRSMIIKKNRSKFCYSNWIFIGQSSDSHRIVIRQ